MSGATPEEGGNKMSPEELQAENRRLEEEIRKAHNYVDQLKREHGEQMAARKSEIELLKKQVALLESSPLPFPGEEPAEIEIEFPGLMRIKLTGQAAARSCVTEDLIEGKHRENKKDAGKKARESGKVVAFE